MENSQNKSRKRRSKYSSFKLQSTSAYLEEAWLTTLVAVLLVIQSWMFFINPQLATLTCDRPSSNLGICKLILSGLLGKKVVPFPLTQLESAEVKHHGKLRQLVLVLPDNKLYFPVDQGFGSPENKAAQINAFLQDSEIKSLSLRQDNRWLIYSAGVIVTALGSCVTWFRILDLLKRSSPGEMKSVKPRR
ncbi:MAG: hypothetical protein KME12_06760 [Trichocoleus desertorum ATA4-8-CV12]|jgi:hypothetical protein|nr:hypothetical protein [Trichocoleus desertorum ATA4-8-CV12]